MFLRRIARSLAPDFLAHHRADLESLRQTLFANMAQDAIYGTFPHMPVGLNKITEIYGPFRMRHLFDPAQPRSQYLAVRTGEGFQEFLGTLGLCNGTFKVIGPTDQDGVDRLINALMICQDHDTASRTLRQPAPPAGPDMSNVVPLFPTHTPKGPAR